MHLDLIEEHGGKTGQLDLGRLEAALARARNNMTYGDADMFTAVAALASGIVNNNPFVDGNKRVAAVVAIATLDINGFDLDVTNRDLADRIEGLVTHKYTEQQTADWLRENAVAAIPPPGP